MIDENRHAHSPSLPIIVFVVLFFVYLHFPDFIDHRQTAAIVFDRKVILANSRRKRNSGTVHGMAVETIWRIAYIVIIQFKQNKRKRSLSLTENGYLFEKLECAYYTKTQM